VNCGEGVPKTAQLGQLGMKTKLTCAVALATVMGTFAHAQTVAPGPQNIDFNPPDGIGNLGWSYSQDGYTITDTNHVLNAFQNWIALAKTTNNPSLAANNAAGDKPDILTGTNFSTIYITNDAGHSFSFNSIGLAAPFLSLSNAEAGVGFTFNYADGTSHSVVVGWAANTPFGLLPFTFDEHNLSSVAMSPLGGIGGWMQFDDLGVATETQKLIQLPTVTDNLTFNYSFSFPILAPGQTYWVDPLVATGYIYKTGAGDPNFASVSLPDVGNTNPYDLYLWNGSAFVFDTTLAPDTVFSFASGGVSEFEVLGIDPSLGLDPSDPTSFVTGLTFTDTGEFTGTMTAVTDDVAAGAPEPSTWAMMLIGFAGLGYAGFCRSLKGRLA
jgi:hypothetical protein